MDFNVSFIDRFVLFACFMAAAEIEKICNFFPTPPRLLSHLWAASLPHVVNRCYFIHHVSCYAHTKPRLLQAAQEVNDVKAQWIILKALPSKHWRKLWGGAGRGGGVDRERNWDMTERKRERESKDQRGGWWRAGGGPEEGWNCDTDPASSCLVLETPGGKQERNDKASSINILSTLLADVYRQFHTTATDSLPFFSPFYMAFLFPVLLPASQSLTICLYGVSSQLP